MQHPISKVNINLCLSNLKLINTKRIIEKNKNPVQYIFSFYQRWSSRDIEEFFKISISWETESRLRLEMRTLNVKIQTSVWTDAVFKERCQNLNSYWHSTPAGVHLFHGINQPIFWKVLNIISKNANVIKIVSNDPDSPLQPSRAKWAVHPHGRQSAANIRCPGGH